MDISFISYTFIFPEVCLLFPKSYWWTASWSHSFCLMRYGQFLLEYFIRSFGGSMKGNQFSQLWMWGTYCLYWRNICLLLSLEYSKYIWMLHAFYRKSTITFLMNITKQIRRMSKVSWDKNEMLWQLHVQKQFEVDLIIFKSQNFTNLFLYH